MRTNCLPGSGCRNAGWLHRSEASLISLNSFITSRVIGILALTSVLLGSCRNGVSCLAGLGT